MSNILKNILKLDPHLWETYIIAELNRNDSGITNELISQTISSLTAKSSSRNIGLLLLAFFVDHCETQELEKRAALWVTILLKKVNEYDFKHINPINTLSKLVQRTNESTSMYKEFSSIHILKILDSVLNVASEEIFSSLRCVKICLKLYTPHIGSRLAALEQFLASLIEVSDDAVTQECGECWLLLQVLTGDVKKVNHKIQWKNYQMGLIGSLHDLMDEAFVNCQEMYEYPHNEDRFRFANKSFSSDPLQRATEVYIRFGNLIKYLEISISEPFPVAKQICVKKLLNLISRGLSITQISLGNNLISENIAVAPLLPNIHIKILELLEILIITLRHDLKPYSVIILRLLLQTLQWTSSNGVQRKVELYGLLRITAYQVFETWCATLNSGSFCDIIYQPLIQEIIHDITPIHFTGVTLKLKKNKKTSQSKQFEAKNAYSTTDEFLKTKYIGKLGYDVCISAYQCLKNLMDLHSHGIQPGVIKDAINKIILITSSFYELSKRDDNFYFSWQCRLEAYNALNSMLATQQYCKFLSQTILNVLYTAIERDNCLIVRNRCLAIVGIIENTVHPQKETLLLSDTLRRVDSNFEFKSPNNISNTNNDENDQVLVNGGGGTETSDDFEMGNNKLLQTETPDEQHTKEVMNLEVDMEPQLNLPELDSKKSTDNATETVDNPDKESALCPDDNQIIDDLESAFVNELN